MARLDHYARLLMKWNAAINLVGKATEKEIWQRHITDSYQLVPLLPPAAQSLADLGSGGGLPGLILACACPALAITLVERDTRKASFLAETARALALKHITVRIEDATAITDRFDVVTARALAPLSELCQLAAPLSHGGTVCLFPKGANYATELAEAQRDWSFDCRLIPSKTHADARIVSLQQLKRAE